MIVLVEDPGHAWLTARESESGQAGPDLGIQVEDITRAAAPDASSYVNETDYHQPDWQRSFRGDNYAQLLEIKHTYDPGNLFRVHHGVGSETTHDQAAELHYQSYLTPCGMRSRRHAESRTLSSSRRCRHGPLGRTWRLSARNTPVRRDRPNGNLGMSPTTHDRHQREHPGASTIVA